jgi:hypothetical protein
MWAMITNRGKFLSENYNIPPDNELVLYLSNGWAKWRFGEITDFLPF